MASRRADPDPVGVEPEQVRGRVAGHRDRRVRGLETGGLDARGDQPRPRRRAARRTRAAPPRTAPRARVNRQPRTAQAAAQPMAASVWRATPASSHGIAPAAYRIVGSWPLPASRTTSPGRARAKRLGDRRPAVRDAQHVHAPACGPPPRRRRRSPRRSRRRPRPAGPRRWRRRGGSARPRSGPSRPAWRCRARRPSRRPRSARRRRPRRSARGGRARPGATPASARSRRSPRTAGPARCAPSAPARRAPSRGRSAPRPGPAQHLAEGDDRERVVGVEAARQPQLESRRRPTAPCRPPVGDCASSSTAIARTSAEGPSRSG